MEAAETVNHTEPGAVADGAAAFLALMDHIRDLSESTVARLGDEVDGRDYPAMVDAIQAAISEHFDAAGDEHRQGFLRGMADVLCSVADGCVPSQEFDPLRTTAGAFLRAKSPPLDTVLVPLTKAVERDLEQRGALPELRRAKAESVQGAASLHYLTPDQARAVLDDAEARARQVRGGLLGAYLKHAKNIRAAMEEAARRPAAFAAAGPTNIAKEGVPGERWRGTKAQLATLGIQLDGPWPHEPGGATRWAPASDARGRKVCITRPSGIWPDLFEAFISATFEGHREKPGEDDIASLISRYPQQFAAGVAIGLMSEPTGHEPPMRSRAPLRLAWSAEAASHP